MSATLEGGAVPKMLETVVGGVLLAAGVATAIIHYVVEGNDGYSYATLAIAAVLLVAGWALFDRGLGISRRRRADGGQGDLDRPA
jgi:hypothetical protein